MTKYDRLYHLLDNEDYNQAKEIIENQFKETLKLNDKEKLIHQISLYGILIDIGCESQNENDLKKAITFYESKEKELEGIITKSSYYYNLANAKHGLSKIFYSKNRGVHTLSTTKEKFQEPINLYWLAYKTRNHNDDSLLPQILINLSNSLITVNRIVEGLQFLDIVLKKHPSFPQALISKGDSLNYLNTVTNSSTSVALYTQIYQSYNKGILSNKIPPTLLKKFKHKRAEVRKKLEDYNFDINDLKSEIVKTKEEYDKHTSFRKFCIDNHLSLNQHAIYCGCVAAEKDDLQIGVKHGTFKSNIIPKLELLLNRIKSEFAFARWMYYKSNSEEPFDYDIKFSELLDGEIINSQSEMLRSSFRICYGILDKIALGICKLYNLDSKRIHFETFWEDKKRKAKLNEIKNIHLTALYSIACDLNTRTGELKQFKNWRNKLEHNLLILKDTSKDIPDVLNIFDDEQFVAVVDINDFNSKTINLLQHTRAAIFSYVYCVRLQTIMQKPNEDDKTYFSIDFKD